MSMAVFDPEFVRKAQAEKFDRLFAKIDAEVRASTAVKKIHLRPPAELVRVIIAQEELAGGLRAGSVMSQSRQRPVVRARWTVWSRLREYGYSTTTIGLTTGNWDHTSVQYGLKQHAGLASLWP